MPKQCNQKCRHLRGIAYGFDSSRILTPYNGKDKLATCEHRPTIIIHMRSLPTCIFGGKSNG